MVSDSKDINPRTVRAHNLGTGSVTTAKAGKKIIHTEAADPTSASDAGTGFEVGSLWNNTSSGEVFICTNSSEEDSVWFGQEGENINLVQFTAGSATGYTIGGYNAGKKDTIYSLSLTSDASAVDTGEELTVARYNNAGAKSATNFFSSGDYPGGPGDTHAIDAYTISSPHTYSDWGEITVDTSSTASTTGHNNDTYAWTVGGYPTGNDTIQKYVTVSAANSTDVGEYPVGIRNAVGATDSISGYGYVFAGDTPSPAQVGEIARFSLTSDGNAADVGNLTQVTGHTSCGPEASYAFIVEGNDPRAAWDDLNRLAWTSSGDATDVGEVSRVMNSAKDNPSIHNSTHWYQVGGYTHPATAYVDTVDKISYTSPYPLTDVGEIGDSSLYHATASI